MIPSLFVLLLGQLALVLMCVCVCCLSSLVLGHLASCCVCFPFHPHRAKLSSSISPTPPLTNPHPCEKQLLQDKKARQNPSQLFSLSFVIFRKKEKTNTTYPLNSKPQFSS